MNDQVMVGGVVADRFRIEAVVGRGGMATVYRAVDLQLGRPVAIKVFESLDESDAARRQTEMRVLAHLSHPNLVALFDAQLGAETPNFLVMELVDGPSLRQLIAGRTLDGPTITEVATGVGNALGAVHAAGLVHRDIKPGNVLIAPTGDPNSPTRAKLVDFGISHLVGSSRITRHDSIIGTGEYLAPEQLSANQIGPASDIYALGLLLLECFVGSPAFPGTTPEAILVRMHRDPRIPAEVPTRWRQLIEQMTHRDPERRPDSRTVAGIALALAPDIRDWIPAGETASPAATLLMPAPAATISMTEVLIPEQESGPPTRLTRRPGVLVGAATALAVLVALALIGATNVMGSDSSSPGGTPSPSHSIPSTTAITSPSPTIAPATNGNGHGKGNGKPKKTP